MYQADFYLKVFRFEPAINFKPVIEPNIEGAFITEDPVDTIISGKSAHVPLMIGVTTEEGALRSAGIDKRTPR